MFTPRAALRTHTLYIRRHANRPAAVFEAGSNAIAGTPGLLRQDSRIPDDRTSVAAAAERRRPTMSPSYTLHRPHAKRPRTPCCPPQLAHPARVQGGRTDGADGSPGGGVDAIIACGPTNQGLRNFCRLIKPGTARRRMAADPAPAVAPAVDPQWANSRPSTMTRVGSVRRSGPQALRSQQWPNAVNEVKSLGRVIDSTTRPATDQTADRPFWSDGNSVGTYIARSLECHRRNAGAHAGRDGRALRSIDARLFRRTGYCHGGRRQINVRGIR